MCVYSKVQRGLGNLLVPGARVTRWLILALGILLLQACSIAKYGVTGHGPRFSRHVILAQGIFCAIAAYGASRRSGPVGRYFWGLFTFSFLFWAIAQLNNAFGPSGVLTDFFFQFSTLPLGLALFLEADRKCAYFDPLHYVDLVQTLLLWLTLYVYFTPANMKAGIYGPLWNRSLVVDSPADFHVSPARQAVRFAHHSLAISQNICLLHHLRNCRRLRQSASASAGWRIGSIWCGVRC